MGNSQGAGSGVPAPEPAPPDGGDGAAPPGGGGVASSAPTEANRGGTKAEEDPRPVRPGSKRGERNAKLRPQGSVVFDRFRPKPESQEERELRHRVAKARNEEVQAHFAHYERSRINRVPVGEQGKRHAYTTDEWADPMQALLAGPAEGEFEKEAGEDSVVHYSDMGLTALAPQEVQRWAPVCIDAELARNALSSLPASFGSLQFLQKLDLSDNRLQELPESFGRLRALTHLDLSGNTLWAVPESFANLENLTRVWLSRNSLAALPELFDSTQLEVLVAEENQIAQVPASIERFARLGTLLLSDNRIRELPPQIGKLKALRRLSLANNDIAELPSSFAMLELLAFLRLEGNARLSLLSVRSANTLGNVESYTLSETGVDAVPTGLPRSLIAYSQRHCRLITVLPEVCTRWINLRDLDLSHNRISSLPSEIELAKHLRTLQLSDNDLAALPDEICACRALIELRLARNKLTKLPAAIGRLTQLSTVDLSENKHLQSLPASFSKLTNLRVLCLWRVGLHTRQGSGVAADVQQRVLTGPSMRAVRMDRALLAKMPSSVVEHLTKRLVFADA